MAQFAVDFNLFTDIFADKFRSNDFVNVIHGFQNTFTVETLLITVT